MTEEVLIIRHGALGDLVQSTGPMAAIRKHHADARITLLTTPAFHNFMEACPWIDRIWLDERPKWNQVRRWWLLFKCLREGGFSRVYDLQTSGRSSLYLRAFSFGERPEWSGIAIGASHPHANAARDSMHTLARQSEQLRFAGIDHVPPPDLSWAAAEAAAFDLPERYALLIPGGSAHRPEKRWPAACYAEVADLLSECAVTPVLVGGADERDLAREIAGRAGSATIDLTGRTTLFDLAGLADGALLALGNDTGPAHVVAVSGAPTLTLFSGASDPALCAPVGQRVAVLRHDPLLELSVGRVWTEMLALQPQIERSASQDC